MKAHGGDLIVEQLEPPIWWDERQDSAFLPFTVPTRRMINPHREPCTLHGSPYAGVKGAVCHELRVGKCQEEIGIAR